MPNSSFCRGLLIALLAWLCLPAFAAALSAVDPRQTWQLLDYVAVDYGAAVQTGRVVSEAEYAEMREFAGAVRTQLATLQRCAHDYLGIVPPGVVVCAWRPHDLQRLALQVQENASTMEEPPILSLPDVGTTPASVYVRNH